MTTILITNVHGQPGIQLARILGTYDGMRLIGVGQSIPALPSGCLDSQMALPTGYELVDFLRCSQVDVVIHLDIAGETQPVRDAETALQQHVLDGMLLLGACAAAGVRRVILRSSTLVYGARPDNPSFICETRPPGRLRQPGLIRNYRDLDCFAADFARQHPALDVVIMRCAGLVGNGVWSPLAHYLMHPAPRMLPGFNPRIQMLHPEDAASAFALAALGTASGCFNLAADAPLTLAQAIRLTGKQPATLPRAFSLALGMDRTDKTGGAWPLGRDFLCYDCVADTRRARDELGWQPVYQARDSLHTLTAPPQQQTSLPPTLDISSICDKELA